MNPFRLFGRKTLQRSPQAPVNEPVSANYRQLESEQAASTAQELRDSWKACDIPARQRALVDTQLAVYRKGEVVPVFDSLVDILSTNISDLSGARVLEIGCSSGYYSEVFAIKRLGVSYEGCDYSPAFIRLARELYPGTRFKVEDAVSLTYPSAYFDIVVSGGCILHIPEYDLAIGEAARVSRRWVVFHRTPVLHMSGPISYRKNAYGVETFEVQFNEQKLVRMFARHRMRVVDVNTHSIGWEPKLSDAAAMKTYLCEKIADHA